MIDSKGITNKNLKECKRKRDQRNRGASLQQKKKKNEKGVCIIGSTGWGSEAFNPLMTASYHEVSAPDW